MAYRLSATLDQDGETEEKFTTVTRMDAAGTALEERSVAKQDRNAVQVHYLPARRNPSDHISYSANALLGRALRAADWSAERNAIGKLTEQITAALADNPAVQGISEEIAKAWGGFHKGKFFADPSISFARGEIESLLRHLSLSFSPGHDVPLVDFSRLSDGQQSLLYIAIVLATRQSLLATAERAGDSLCDPSRSRPCAPSGRVGPYQLRGESTPTVRGSR